MAKFVTFNPAGLFENDVFFRIPIAERLEFQRLAPNAVVLIKEYGEAVTYSLCRDDLAVSLALLKYAEYQVRAGIRLRST